MPLKEEFIAYISREEGARHATQGHMGFEQEQKERRCLGHLLHWGFCGQNEMGQWKWPRTG